MLRPAQPPRAGNVQLHAGAADRELQPLHAIGQAKRGIASLVPRRGAEYWMLRKQSGDPSYLDAFDRVIA